MKRGSRDLWALFLLLLLLLLLLMLLAVLAMRLAAVAGADAAKLDGFGVRLAMSMLVLLMGAAPETTMRRRETGLVLGIAAGACFDEREWEWGCECMVSLRFLELELELILLLLR